MKFNKFKVLAFFIVVHFSFTEFVFSSEHGRELTENFSRLEIVPHTISSRVGINSNNDLVSRVCAEIRQREDLLHRSRGRHIVAFLGDTGAGKSALINFIAGVKMDIDPINHHFSLPSPHDHRAMPIAPGMDSVTYEPKAIQIDKNGQVVGIDDQVDGGLLLYDLPGFKDSNGYERNLVNAAFIKEILIKAASVRLVIVSSFGAFEDGRGQSFTNMYGVVRGLFPNNEIVQRSSILVVTKVPIMHAAVESCINCLHLAMSSRSQNPSQSQIMLGEFTQSGKFAHMLHAGHLMYLWRTDDAQRDEVQRRDHWTREREYILDRIRNIPAGVVSDINISVVDTKIRLKEIFYALMEEKLDEELRKPTSLSELDKMSSDLIQSDYWERFSSLISSIDEIKLLKSYCGDQYSAGLRDFKECKSREIKRYIDILKANKRERKERIEANCKERTRIAISSHHVQFGFITDISKIVSVLEPSFYEYIHASVCNDLTDDVREIQVILGFFDQHMKEYREDQIDKFERFSYETLNKSKFFSARIAAGKGYAHGQNALGECYEEGKGVDQNDEEAVAWYQKAADQGYAEAQFNLGTCYDNGKGVVKNIIKAAELYQKAAEQSHIEAQLYLGACYFDGKGVVKDLSRAVAWYQKAADQGNAGAQNYLGDCYSKGTGVARNLTRAIEFYREAADQGYADAQFSLGLCYEEGRGVAKNNTEALKWYRMAADQKHTAAAKKLRILLHVDVEFGRAAILY